MKIYSNEKYFIHTIYGIYRYVNVVYIYLFMHSQCVALVCVCVRARFMRCLAACQLKLPRSLPPTLSLTLQWHLLLPAMCAMHAEQAQQQQQNKKKEKKEAMQSNDCVSCRRGQ